MGFGPHDKKLVEAFLEAIKPRRAAYTDPTFSYIAVKAASGWLLLKGQVSLLVQPPKIPLSHFVSANVRAGSCRLSDLADTPEEFLEIIETGRISINGEMLLFPPTNNGQHNAYFQPFHQAGLQNQNRLDVLGIVGAVNTEVNRTLQLDWEVKGAPTPYDSLAEIAIEYQTGTLRTDAIGIEIVAYNVAVFDLSSAATGAKANVGLRLAKGADPTRASLGYRVISQGKVSARGVIPGSDFNWTEEAEHRQGWASLDVPVAPVIHGIAIYDGVAQHQGWALDPTQVQNPRRAAYECFDKGLQFMSEVLAREGKGGNARDLETVTGWLLWMLGFSVANLGSTPRTQDAPDNIAVTPAGHVAVVEVTTGLLGTDKKLNHLHDRALAVRNSFAKSGNSHLRIMPVMITSRTREEVQHEIDQALKMGVFVITKDGLDEMVTRTMLIPRPEELYEEAERTLRSAREAPHQPDLPGVIAN